MNYTSLYAGGVLDEGKKLQLWRSVEPIVHADTQNVVGNVRAPAISAGIRGKTGPAESSEVDEEVFNFPSPVGRICNGSFDAATNSPTDHGPRLAECPVTNSGATAGESIEKRS